MNPNKEPGEMMGGEMPHKAAMGGEDQIPLSALAMPDEKEAMQPPAVGDKVQYTVEGTVTRIEGDNAYVKRSAVNGQEMAEPEAPVDEMAELEAMAAEQPERY